VPVPTPAARKAEMRLSASEINDLPGLLGQGQTLQVELGAMVRVALTVSQVFGCPGIPRVVACGGCYPPDRFQSSKSPS
jgi:hypothetical protein